MEDKELVLLAQRGDDVAAETLFDRYRGMVRAKANLYFMVGADKDDITQEGMIGLFKAMISYEDDKGAVFSTYADRCVNNQILSAVQKASRLKHEPLNTSLSIHDLQMRREIEEVMTDESEATPEMALLIQEQLDYIIKESDRLFSKLESQVWKEYLKGKDYIEISNDLDKSPKSIDNTLQRMKKKVQNLWHER